MIFCEKLLFLHVPKTGGQSITQMLLEVLPRPVYLVHENSEMPHVDFDDVTHVSGLRHGNLKYARRRMPEFGYSLEGFPIVLVVLRNPYALEVSRFAYQMQTMPRKGASEREFQLHDQALNESFESFAIRTPLGNSEEWSIESYFQLDDVMPPNLRVLRLENIDVELRQALGSIGIEMIGSVPRINASAHGDYTAYYTRAAEEAVYEKYRWVFDSGYYARLDPERFVLAAESREDLRDQAIARLQRRVRSFRLEIAAQEKRLTAQAAQIEVETERALALEAEIVALEAAKDELIGATETMRTMQASLRELQAMATTRQEQLEATTWEIRALEARQQELAAAQAEHDQALAVQDAVRTIVPVGATVLVVSRGDPELLSVGRREAWHFPRTAEGWYAGEYPADDDGAIEHLEALREQGATHLVLPCSSAWWLEHYAGFASHLNERYCCLLHDETCIVFDLAGRTE